MKIAIYHNLEPGGALVQLNEISRHFRNSNNTVCIYSLNKNTSTAQSPNNRTFKIKQTKNIITHLIQALYEIPRINKIIAKEINNGNYDLIFVFPCLICQSPSILKYINNKNKLYYFFAEPKREFYEATSYDHYKFTRILKRILRIPIMLNDIKNCQQAKYIFANSVYSKFMLQKIYNKPCQVVYPGLQNIEQKIYKITNSQKLLSVGLLSRIKGHDFSIKQLANSSTPLTIIGNKTVDYDYLKNITPDNENIIFMMNTNNLVKNSKYNVGTTVLSNQNNEPFGITTLEGVSNNLYVLGINTGGTPEIVQHGLNGFLYPKNLSLAKKVLVKTMTKKNIIIYKTTDTNWKETVNRIIRVTKSTKPNE